MYYHILVKYLLCRYTANSISGSNHSFPIRTVHNCTPESKVLKTCRKHFHVEITIDTVGGTWLKAYGTFHFHYQAQDGHSGNPSMPNPTPVHYP